MSQPSAVTLILCTYNRAELLGAAIECLLQQADDSPRYEVVLVDNNSSDHTRRVIERCSRASSTTTRVRYVFEPRQGLSHARNAGILAAQSSLLAFTDDDVRIAPDWVKVIKRTFDAHPDVDSLGGRILPVWPAPPPSWLTSLHWVGPLALQDYGDEPFTVDALRPLCLAGANFAFRKDVFDRVGPFAPEFTRSEDTELMVRLWRSGAKARYVPEMKAYAAVQPERLTKAYHRRWHSNIGRCNARMRLAELIESDGSLRSTPAPIATVLGVPRFALRQLAREAVDCVIATARGREAEAFWHETQARTLIGYMRESRALAPRRGLTRRPNAEPGASLGVNQGSSSHSVGATK